MLDFSEFLNRVESWNEAAGEQAVGVDTLSKSFARLNAVPVGQAYRQTVAGAQPVGVYLSRTIDEFGAKAVDVPGASPAANTIAIQAAINYGLANHCRIVVPPGVYQIDGTLNIDTPAHDGRGLILEGMTHASETPYSQSMIYYAGEAELPMLYIRGTNGCTLRHLLFDTAGAAACAVQQCHVPGDSNVCHVFYEQVCFTTGTIAAFVLGQELTGTAVDIGDCSGTHFRGCQFLSRTGRPPPAKGMCWLRNGNSFGTAFYSCNWHDTNWQAVGDESKSAPAAIVAEAGTFYVYGGVMCQLGDCAIILQPVANGNAPSCTVIGVEFEEVPEVLRGDMTASGVTGLARTSSLIDCNHSVYQWPWPGHYSVNWNAPQLVDNSFAGVAITGGNYSHGIRRVAGNVFLSGVYFSGLETSNIFNAAGTITAEAAIGTWYKQGIAVTGTAGTGQYQKTADGAPYIRPGGTLVLAYTDVRPITSGAFTGLVLFSALGLAANSFSAVYLLHGNVATMLTGSAAGQWGTFASDKYWNVYYDNGHFVLQNNINATPTHFSWVLIGTDIV